MKPYFYDDKSAFREQVLNSALLFVIFQRCDVDFLIQELAFDKKTAQQIMQELLALHVLKYNDKREPILCEIEVDEIMTLFANYLPTLDTNMFYLKYVDILEMEKTEKKKSKAESVKPEKKHFFAKLFS